MFKRIHFLLLPLFVMGGCALFQVPAFQMGRNLDVVVIKWDGNKPTIRTIAKCFNQNKVGFAFKGGEATIYLDTLKLGKALIDTSFFVPAQSVFEVPAQLQIDLAYLSTHGLKLDNTMVTVEGNFKGSVAGVVKSMPVHYKGFHDINLIMKPFTRN